MTHSLRVYSAALLVALLSVACSDSGGSSSLGLLPDTDGDGLPDSLESKLGSDPKDPDSPYVEGDDDDNTAAGPGPDAIVDGLERYLSATGALTPITAATDSDLDHVPDYLEVASGLNPQNPNDPIAGGASDAENPSGPAFDGIADGLESYLLRRGATAPVTPTSDSDRDGISDVLEVRSGSNPFDVTDPAYARAIDLDGDQVPDWLERRDGFDPLLADFPTFDGGNDNDGGLLGPDGDGVKDGLEGWLVTHGSAAPATMGNDSDADGVPDVVEVRAGFDPFDPNTPLADGAGDADGDEITDSLENLLIRKGALSATPTTDSDRDLIADFAEILSGWNPFDPSEPQLFDHFDIDGDGLFDFLEHQLGADPLDPESPQPQGAMDVNDATGPARDPLTDAMEALLVARGTSAPVTTYTDSDGDGIPDYVELRWVSNPLDPDSPVVNGDRDDNDLTGPPGDGLSDGAEHVLIELGAAGPQDLLRNSDADVIPDAIELITGSNWLNRSSPAAGEGPDIDGDGAFDYLELMLGFDPSSANDPVPAGGSDTDADGLTDALEEALRLNGATLPITPVSDSDGDGLFDYLEAGLASSANDSNSPVVNGGADLNNQTGPPNDGLSDALEFYLIASGARRPISPRTDSDSDAVPDFVEIRLALDPFDPASPVANGAGDDDGDGVANSLEIVLALLGSMEPIDGKTDSDADGAPDYLEVFAGGNIFDVDHPVPSGASDADADGLTDALEFVLVTLGASSPLSGISDTDGDGIPDGYEVSSGTHPFLIDHPLPSGNLDLDNLTGPVDTISDGLESLLVSQGATAPVTHGTDSDLDRAPDHLEVLAGSSPFDSNSPVLNGTADSDGDRLTDGLESVLITLGAVEPLDTRSDTDRDGAPDFFEIVMEAHPIHADVPIPAGDGLGFDMNSSTGPNGDNLSDAFELLLIQFGCTPPIGTASDTDLDGLPDHFEIRTATNPLDSNSPINNGGSDSNNTTGPSGDLISDGLEAILIGFGGTAPITISSDTDGDGVPDFYEVFKGSDPFDINDAILPGTLPIAIDVSISGINLEGRELTGRYTYFDAEFDPEGTPSFQWLRDGVSIPGATGTTYTLTATDIQKTLSFRVTPESLFAWTPNTAFGMPAKVDRVIPLPSYPQGTGGPGGVGIADGASDVRLWLKADDETVVADEDGDVSAWMDRSGYDRNAVEADPMSNNDTPTLEEDIGPNAELAVHFDGNRNRMVLPRPVEDSFTLAAAFVTDSDENNVNWWRSPAILGGETPAPCSMDYHLGINDEKPLFVVQDRELTTSVTTVADAMPHWIFASRQSGTGRMRLGVDGTLRGTVLSGKELLTCPENLFLGSSTDTTGFWEGDLFEVCAFDRALGATERLLLDNYFAVRVGTLPALSIYDRQATHSGEVAGIGRESSTDFVERAEGQGILRVATPSALSDGDYLVWGTDSPGNFTLSTDVPAPYSRRLLRTWSYTITDGGNGDGVGTVNIRFRVGGLFLSKNPSDFALLLDADGAFFDASLHPGPAFYDSNSDTVEFLGVTLGSEPLIGLAVKPL